jgi:predicted small secreted protein
MSNENRRQFLAAAAAATAAALCGGLLAGCNTVEGVGEDIERAGDAIGDKARREKRRD